MYLEPQITNIKRPQQNQHVNLSKSGTIEGNNLLRIHVHVYMKHINLKGDHLHKDSSKLVAVSATESDLPTTCTNK